MCKVRVGQAKSTILEDVHRVTKFKKYLPAGAEGGNRKRSLVQFFAEEGGFRTVAEGDIVEVK